MMKILRNNAGGVILCLAEIVIGILLLVDATAFTSGIIILAGIVLMVMGLGDIVKYFHLKAEEAAAGRQLSRGLTVLLAGAFCTFNFSWFLNTFPVIAIIYGVGILVAGIEKVQMAVDMYRLKKEKWFLGAAGSALSVICAMIIIWNPFASMEVLWVFTGISLVLEAVLDMVTLFINSGTIRHRGDTRG